jgi:hypothetical protein
VNKPSRVDIGILCLTLLALALAGCGRRNPPEPPPGVPASEAVNPAAGPVAPTGTSPILPQNVPTTGSNLNPPSKGPPFFLDPLVK